MKRCRNDSVRKVLKKISKVDDEGILDGRNREPLVFGHCFEPASVVLHQNRYERVVEVAPKRPPFWWSLLVADYVLGSMRLFNK